MGVISVRFFSTLAIFPLLALAAPQLRLSQSNLPPISIATGGNATAQVQAFNSGDGNLALRVNSSAPWLTASAGGAGDCLFREGTCTPVNISIQAGTLARGTYTGVVTVSDPNAVDAPQGIRVTIQVGGGVPDRVDLFVAPGGTRAEQVFTTASPLDVSVTTATGGNWLSVVSEGGNPFRNGTTYRVIGTVPSGTAEGTLNGTIVTQGSTLGAENKTIPVTLRVTNQPIAQVSSSSLDFRLAQGSAKQVTAIAVTNRGLGTIDATAATVTTASGGGWLTAERTSAGLITVTANPAGLAPGTYDGSVAIANNGAAGVINVPARLTVVATAAPVATYRGVVNNATFEAGDVVAQGSIVAIFGEQFTTGDAKQATSLPLGTDLGGAKVFVNNVPAPVYYVSANQINFQIPYDAAPGDAVVRVERDGQRGNDVSVRIAKGAPRLLRLGVGNYAIAVNQDGSFPIATTPGLNSRPARAGETLVLYAIGGGPTSPDVTSGTAAPANPLGRSTGSYAVTFGVPGPFGDGVATVTPGYVGLTPNFVGLYQVNVTIPEDAPKGSNIPVVLVSGDYGPSNTVTVAIQ